MATDPFLGEIKLVGFNFEPRGWAFCRGQILPIAQNTALFSLLGTMYGGNGQTTFALPDLRGRVPVGFGQGPGLSDVVQGEMAGTENVTLLSTQMPLHSHLVQAVSGGGNSGGPGGNYPAASTARDSIYSSGQPNANLNTAAVAPSGGSQPHENRQPYLGLNYIIALQGIFPSRQ